MRREIRTVEGRSMRKTHGWFDGCRPEEAIPARFSPRRCHRLSHRHVPFVFDIPSMASRFFFFTKLSLMVYYIRFLKTPRVQKQKTGALSVSALICITTDLGDAFLAEDVDLLVSLNASNADQVLYQERVKWTASKREVPIALGPFPPHLSKHTLVLSVCAPTDPRKPRAPSADTLLPGQQDVAPLVISGWSAPFGGSESPVAEKLVERRFGPQGLLRIWEETGNSIARHIW